MSQRRLEILFLCHRIPYPPDKGDKIRSYHELEYLAARHRVTLGCFVDDPDDLAHVPKLESMCEHVRVDRIQRIPALFWGGVELLRGRPLSLGYFHDGAFARWVRDVSRATRFDAVLAFSSSMGRYALDAATDGARVMDLVDLDSEKWRQYAAMTRGPKSWLYRLEASRMKSWESYLLEHFDHTVVCTDDECEELRRHHGHGSADAIHNGVDFERFPFEAPAERGPVIAFTGAMDYFPNVDAVVHFANDVFPLVRERRPDAEFWIIGRHPAPRVRELDAKDGIRVTGGVPDIGEYLHQAAVAVAPLRVAQGVQNKVLEAMSSGAPVVASSKAFLGISAESGRDLVIADEPAAMADAVVRLLEDGTRRVELAKAARRQIESEYCWDRSVEKLERLLTTRRLGV